MESMFVLIFYIAMRIYSVLMFIVGVIMLLFNLFVIGAICAAIANPGRGDGSQLSNLFNRHQ